LTKRLTQKSSRPSPGVAVIDTFAAKNRAVVDRKSIKFIDCRLPGCFLVEFPVFNDHRGVFVKSFQRTAFQRRGLEYDFNESFYTESGENVLRGMHFQLPPADHAKLIYCLSGAIFDLALDLRVGSPTFGQCESYELSAESRNAAYLPKGVAHGFFVRSAPSVVVYQVTSEHSLMHDSGIRWDSFGATWPCSDPIVSQRDQDLLPFLQFDSPFQFESESAIRTGSN
jgi:dTDP-4-dehydrorhamnose 3,5-epimerase